MKFYLYLILITVLLSAPSHAGFNDAFNKGDHTVFGGLSIYPFGIYGAYEYGVHPLVSIGGSGGLIYWGVGNNSSVRQFSILGRGTFHPFNLPALQHALGDMRPHLDIYCGLYGGLSLHTDTAGDFSSHGTEFVIGPYVGTKFFLNEKFGIFGEITLSHERARALGWLNFGVFLDL